MALLSSYAVFIVPAFPDVLSVVSSPAPIHMLVRHARARRLCCCYVCHHPASPRLAAAAQEAAKERQGQYRRVAGQAEVLAEAQR